MVVGRIPKKSTGTGLVAVVIGVHKQLQSDSRQPATQAVGGIAQPTSQAFGVAGLAGVGTIRAELSGWTGRIAYFCGVDVVETT